MELRDDYDREYALSKNADLKYAQKFYEYRLYILKELIEHDKYYVINALRKRIEFVEGEYKRLDNIKNEFDRYINNDRILWLFVAGITIQVLSLVFPPITIITIISFSPAIIIVIRCLLLLLDEL